jgi:N,N'-diacetyllegionaminate synthase
MIAGLELSMTMYDRLFRHARDRGIEFMSTAFDSGSAQFLVDLGIKRIKVPSGEITNLPFLQLLAGFGLPILLSTGMATLDEIATALTAIESATEALRPVDVCILHCTSAYPTPDIDVNLLAMRTIAASFRRPVGYSDHTADMFAAPLAVGLGACVIEKHMTIDKSLPGPDHQTSLLPNEMRAMISNIRRVEVLLGDGVKAPRPSEVEARHLVRRGLKAARSLMPGHVITRDDLEILRPASGIAPSELDNVTGRRVARALVAHAPVEWRDLET